MSDFVQDKAARLLREGRIEPMVGPVQHFRSYGDSGIYDTFVGAHVRRCTCKHGREEAPGDCSHITAAVDWVLAQGKRSDEMQRAADLAMTLPEMKADRYEDALAARKASEAEKAEDVFQGLER